jgi:hypothetical protein
MVGTLTWRDTTAPNFYTSVDAQRLAGQSVNNAFAGASDALGKFSDWQKGQAANALANNLAQYPDAASEAAARANGTLWQGVDRSNLTPQALGTVNNNVSTLLSNAADSAKLPYVGPQAAANVQSTISGINVNNANVGGINASTAGRLIDNSVSSATATDKIRAAALANTNTQAGIDSVNAGTAGKLIENTVDAGSATDRIRAAALANTNTQAGINSVNAGTAGKLIDNSVSSATATDKIRAAALANTNTQAGIDSVNASTAGKSIQNTVDVGSAASRIAQAAAGVRNTDSVTNVNNANAGSIGQTTTQGATTFGRGTDEYNNDQLARAAAIKASSGALNLPAALGALDKDKSLNPQAKLFAVRHTTDLMNGVYNPANAAIAAAASGSTYIPPAPGVSSSVTLDQQVAQIKALNPQLTNEECVTLAMKSAGMSGTVSDWRKGSGWSDLPTNAPAATFMDRNHNPSNLYDGGQGVGIGGNDSTHSLIKAPDDAQGNPRAWEQYTGSGGPQLVTLHHGDINPITGKMDRIHNIDNLYGINDANGKPLGDNNPQNRPGQNDPTAILANSLRALGANNGQPQASWTGALTPGSGPGGTDSTLAPPDIAGDFYKSIGTANQVNSDLTARMGQLNAPGTSGVYGAASRDSVPYATVAAQLVDPKAGGVFADIGSDRVQRALDNIKQTGVKYGIDINGAEAGAILSNNATKDPAWWFKKFGFLDGVYPNDSGIDAEVKQIASGNRQSQENEKSVTTAIANVVQSKGQAAQAAFDQLKGDVAVANQKHLPASILKPSYERYNQAKSQWDAALQSANIARFKPKFNTDLNAASPSGVAPSGAAGASSAISNAAKGSNPNSGPFNIPIGNYNTD